jgi:hypothetical protein
MPVESAVYGFGPYVLDRPKQLGMADTLIARLSHSPA